MNLLQDITEAARATVRAFVDDRTDSRGQVSIDSFANFARMAGLQAQPWEAALKVSAACASIVLQTSSSATNSSFADRLHAANPQGTKFAKADRAKLSALFTYLENCLEQIVKDNELGALKQALKVLPLYPPT